jgi:large subunit ribosomal protein L22
MSPKKVRLVTDTIKGMDAREALVRLRFIPKAAAPVVTKLLQSAIANAHHNNSLKVEDLMVKSIVVNQGVALKRSKPAAFGSSHGYKKHASHINLVLGLKPSAESKENKKNEAASKKEVSKAEVTTEKKLDIKKAAPREAKKPAAKKEAESK